MQESGFFARDEPIPGLGPSPDAAARAFDMKPGEVSGPVRARAASPSWRVVGKQAPYMPKLDEVKERVREEVVKRRRAH